MSFLPRGKKNKGLGTCAGGPDLRRRACTCAGGPDLRRRAGPALAGLHPARDGTTLLPGSNILHHSPLLGPRGNTHRWEKWLTTKIKHPPIKNAFC